MLAHNRRGLHGGSGRRHHAVLPKLAHEPVVRPPGLRVRGVGPFLPVLLACGFGRLAPAHVQRHLAGALAPGHASGGRAGKVAPRRDHYVLGRVDLWLLCLGFDVQRALELGRHGLLALLDRPHVGGGYFRGLHHRHCFPGLRDAWPPRARGRRWRDPLHHGDLPLRRHPGHVPPQLLRGDARRDPGHRGLLLDLGGLPPRSHGLGGRRVHGPDQSFEET
mmetsp:Transcript_97444/g.297752  ORF Transcript_97444/g.297752 Transcript_97444/m.297752 type:complete len:220 (-) Transcript_97444:565-1224(-)